MLAALDLRHVAGGREHMQRHLAGKPQRLARRDDPVVGADDHADRSAQGGDQPPDVEGLGAVSEEAVGDLGLRGTQFAVRRLRQRSIDERLRQHLLVGDQLL